MTLEQLEKDWDKRTVEEAHAEVLRERAMREKCFPRWIDEGRIASVDAKDRLQRLMKAEALLEKLLLLQTNGDEQQP